jgi:hypothetical protein
MTDRPAIITEQNAIIAAAYGALLDARDCMAHANCDLSRINAAINQIENWRQQREPTSRLAASDQTTMARG